MLLDCVASLYEFPTNEMEIFVVDNHSTDDSIDQLRSRFPEVKLILNETNKGFPAANNQAILAAKGEYILLLNPDTVLLDDVLDKMIRYMDSHADVMLLAPKLLNTDGSVQFSIQPFISVTEIIAEAFYLHGPLKWIKSYHRKKINVPIDVEALSGAAILVRSIVFEKIGMLDEELFWTEDMEFCYRAYKNRMRIVYNPEFEIIHHGSSSGKKNLNVMISNQILSKVRYFKKNHSLLEYILAWFFRLIHIFTRLILLIPLSILIPTYRAKVSAYFYTLRRFMRGDY
jgi:GT2 family glycosyltransferase